MSKAIQGAAMLGADALLVGAAMSGNVEFAPLAASLFNNIGVELAAGGVVMEAGAIAQALTQQRGMNITTRQPASFRQIIYGTQRVGGIIVYQSTTGSHYDQYNFVIALATHPCYAIENLYLDGRQVFWAQGGNTQAYSSRGGYTFGGNADSNDHIGPNGQHYNFGGLVYCSAYFGDQTDGLVDGGLTANDPKWAATAAGKPWLGGCTYVYLKIEYDQAMFPSLPEIRFTVHGKSNIFDPRTNTSGYATNPALIVADVFSDPTWGLGDSSVNQAQLIAAANVCDEQVSCAGGSLSESRYAASWHYDTSTPPGEVLKVFLDAMGGRLTRSGGEWYIWPAYWQGVSATYGEDQLRAAPSWEPYRAPDKLVNRVNGTYTAPNYPYNVAGNLYDSNGWYYGSIQNNFPFAFQPTNFPQYAADTLHGYPSDSYLAEDGGNQLPMELDLKAVLSVSQAQRLAKIALMRNRQQGSGSLRLSLEAFATVGLDVIQMNFSQLGWTNYQLEVSGEPELSMEGAQFDEGGRLISAPRFIYTVPVQDCSQTVYEWSGTEELTVYDVPSQPSQAPWTPAPPTTVTLESGAAFDLVGADGVVIPRVLVTWTDPADILVTQIMVQYRPTGASNPWRAGPIVPVGVGQAYVTGVVTNQVYDFRVASLRAKGAQSGWVEIDAYTASSSFSSVTATGISPNAPYNQNNDAVLDSVLDASGAAAEIRIYGPGGLGSGWDYYNGQGSQSFGGGTVSGLAFSTTYVVCLIPGTGGFKRQPNGAIIYSYPQFVAESNQNQALADGYIILGSVMTCTSSGTGGGSGGGGGTGSGGTGPRFPNTL